MVSAIVAEVEDPTTQLAWPARHGKQAATGEDDASAVPEQEDVPAVAARNKIVPEKKRLTTWDLITLSISMAGAQIAWTVELGCAHKHTFQLAIENLIGYVDTEPPFSLDLEYLSSLLLSYGSLVLSAVSLLSLL